LAYGRNKYQSRENRERVRNVLTTEWDPIGVRGIPGSDDEYSSYASRVYVMLVDERATPEAIASYLIEVATNRMGLSASPTLVARSERTARLLFDLRPGFEIH